MYMYRYVQPFKWEEGIMRYMCTCKPYIEEEGVVMYMYNVQQYRGSKLEGGGGGGYDIPVKGRRAVVTYCTCTCVKAVNHSKGRRVMTYMYTLLGRRGL